MKKEFRSFEDARKFAQTLKIRNQNDWRTTGKAGKLPIDIPRDPPSVYKKEWKGWGDWLGTGTISMTELSKTFLSYKDARKEVQNLAKELGIKTRQQWIDAKKLGKIPDNIPANPWSVYSKKRKKK